MQRLAKDFERISEKLTSRESEVDRLSRERADLDNQLSKYDQKKDQWRKSTKQLEDYFNEQLEGIRRGFDLQLRDLIEKQKLEIEILEDALQQKQLRVDAQHDAL